MPGSPRADCELCRMAYGFENPPRESVLGSEHFLVIPAFPEIPRGHLIILPKIHYEQKLPGDLALRIELAEVMNRAANYLEKKYPEIKFAAILKNTFVPQYADMAHVHYRVIPEYQVPKIPDSN